MDGLQCPNGQDGSSTGGVKAQSAPSMLILYVYVSGLYGIVYAQGVASQEKKLSNLLLQHTTYPLPPTTTNTPLLTHHSHLPPAGGTRHDPATRGVQPITNHSATDTSSPHCGYRFGHAHRYICPTGCANVAGKLRNLYIVDSYRNEGAAQVIVHAVVRSCYEGLKPITTRELHKKLFKRL